MRSALKIKDSQGVKFVKNILKLRQIVKYVIIASSKFLECQKILHIKSG